MNDAVCTAYDRVARFDIYHRVFWGVSTRAYRAFAERAVTACGAGTMLDAGCGSMLFTARAYRAHAPGAVIGLDASLTMLRLARSRLNSGSEERPVALLRADALRSPFRTGAFDVVLCLHVAHVVSDLRGLLSEALRILRPGGTLFLTSLVLAGHWRDRYMRALSHRGVLASPRRAEDILDTSRALFGSDPDAHVSGNMLFVEATTPARVSSYPAYAPR